jgi:hypothetical protein
MFFLSCNSQKISDRKIIDTHFHAFTFNEYGFPAPPNEITGITFILISASNQCGA